MIKLSKKTIGVFFTLIVLMFASPIMQMLDFDLPNFIENTFEIKANAESYSLSSSSYYVYLDLQENKEKTITIYSSCSTNYGLSCSNETSSISCSWTSRYIESDGNGLKITAKKACYVTPIYISLYRASDDVDLATITIYVTVVDSNANNNTYTVSYNANGGSGAPSSQTKQYNQSLTLSSSYPTRFGYNFLGWSTSSTATSATYLPGSSYTRNASVTLYAVWSRPTLLSGSSDSATINYGGQYYYYKFTPSTSGDYVIYSTSSYDTEVYLFDQSGTQIAYNDEAGYVYDGNFRLAYRLNAGMTYTYAVGFWSGSRTGDIPFKFGQVYTISYNANGGSGAPSSQEKDYGKSITLSSTVPTRSGYSFLGWSTSSSATTVTYSSGATYSSNASTTLYAVWHKHSYTSTITTNPTCTSTGIKTYRCSCGDWYTESIKAKGHTYKTTSTTKATTSKDGLLTQKCNVCSATKKTTIAKIKSVSLSSKSYEYDSKAKTPSVTVKDSNGKTLKKDTDYTVKYASGRKNIGKYTVTVTFKGKYSGKKSLTFEIKLGKVKTLKKIKVSGYALALEWTSVKGASGYQIQRYDSKKQKWVNVGNSTKTRIRIKKLSGTYKWRVRAFKKSDNKTYYGAWSATLQTKS